MQAQMQDEVSEIGVIIEETLADYTPPTNDLKVAARNLLRYGMLGYAPLVGELQEGFCDGSLRQCPGAVPKKDLKGIMEKLYAVLLERGQLLYAKVISQYTDGVFCAFAPGDITKQGSQ